MMLDDKLSTLISALISDGKSLLKKKEAIPRGHGGSALLSDRKGVQRWADRLTLLCSIAPDLIAPWKDRLKHSGKALTPDALEEPLWTLETIKDAIEDGLLVRYEELILADAFSDLQEQAKYLLDQRFFLAAGVILRAILEERLRKLCQKHRRLPEKKNPTINDYNQSLYATPPIYDKTVMLHVISLAAIGNDAAHNVPTLTIDDVNRLNAGVSEFLVKYAN